MKILIVEDDELLADMLKCGLTARFAGGNSKEPEIQQTSSAAQAIEMAKDAKKAPYDLVSLDWSLKEVGVTGADVLEALKENNSAWMVAVITGIGTDEKAVTKHGSTNVEKWRNELTSLVRELFPWDRVDVWQKPPDDLINNKRTALLNQQLNQVSARYRQLAKQRYVFRPVEAIGKKRGQVNYTSAQMKLAKADGVSVLVSKSGCPLIDESVSRWEVRCGCEDQRELDDYGGMKTLHAMFKKGHGGVITAVESVREEPPQKRKTASQPKKERAPESDPASAYFSRQHPNWSTYTAQRRQELIKAALSTKIERFCELRQILDATGLLSPAEDAELIKIEGKFGSLESYAECWYQLSKGNNSEALAASSTGSAQMFQNNLTPKKIRPKEPKENVNLRARMSRLCDYLRSKGCLNFAEYLDKHVKSTSTSWIHRCQSEPIEWTTVR